MIIVLERGTTEVEKQAVIAALEELGLQSRSLDNLRKPLIHVIHGPSIRALRLKRMDRVEALIPTSGPRIRKTGRHFYPYHFINWSSAALALIGVLVVVAGSFPPGVGAEIDPHVWLEGSLAPWYLRAPLAFVELFPQRWLGWLALALVLAVILFLPQLDRMRGEGLRARAPVMVAGLLAGLAWLILTFPGLVG